MEIVLTSEESEALQQALRTYCAELRMEIRDTDNPSFRRGLKHERELLEHVVQKLDSAAAESELSDEDGRMVVRVVTVWSS